MREREREGGEGGESGEGDGERQRQRAQKRGQKTLREEPDREARGLLCSVHSPKPEGTESQRGSLQLTE